MALSRCFLACFDPQLGPSEVWRKSESGAMLHNCLILPWIIDLHSAGRLTPSAMVIAASFDVANLTKLIGKDRWPVINACTIAYCEARGGSSTNCTIDSRMTAQSNYALSEPAFDEAFWTLVSNTGNVEYDELLLISTAIRRLIPRHVIT